MIFLKRKEERSNELYLRFLILMFLFTSCSTMTTEVGFGGGATIGGPLTQCCFSFDYELPSYTTANARLGFRNDRWDVAFYVNNFTNEHARLALDQERGTLARVGFLVNQPRTYGITARVGF